MVFKPILVITFFTLSIVSILFITNLPSYFTETEVQLLFSFPVIFAILGVVGAMKR